MQKKELRKRVKELVKKETKGKYDIMYYESPRSDSFYFRLTKTGTAITLRFSDHSNEGNKLPYCDVSCFNKKEIVRYIQKRINSLEIKKVNALIQTVSV